MIGATYKDRLKIGEHIIQLPPLPKDKKEVLFVDNKPEGAYWQKLTDYPKIWNEFIPYYTKIDQEATIYDQDEKLITLNKEDSNIIRRVYEQEMKRRREGVFFKNGNDIEYLTGSHYFSLQWMKMYGVEGGYGGFWKFQRDIMYLIRHCWSSADILGLFVAKPKKTGVTQLMTGYFLNKSTMTKEQQMGMMSKKGDDAINVNMMFYFHAFDSLPAAFKPRWSNRGDREGMINFAERAYRGKDIRKSTGGSEEFLNTKVFSVPTKPAAFDSPLIHDAWFDELPKAYKESKVEPKKIFDTNKEAVKIQSRFNGRVWITSYANEEDDIGHEQTKQIYYGSKLETMEYGRTQTGLICHHIPAYLAHVESIDKYGVCNQITATEATLRERNRLKKDKKAFSDALRQYSFDEKEFWGSSGFSTVFDTIYLSTIKYELEEEMRQSALPLYIEGKLDWDEPMWNIGKHDRRPPKVFSKVIFKPFSESELRDERKYSFKMFKDIPYDERNLPLRLGRDDLGNLLPPEKFKYVGGCDPTSYADADDVEEASMQASYTMNLHSDSENTRHRELVTRVIMSEYNGRPDLAEEAYQQIVKEIIYFGKLILVEANTPHVYTRLKNEGLGNYLIVKHKDGYLTRWTTVLEDTEYTGVKRTRNAVQNDILESIVELIKHYTYKGQDGEAEYAKTIKSILLLDQFCNFKVEDTKKSDAAMAFGYTLLAYETLRAEMNKNTDEAYNEVAIRALFAATERA